MKSLFTTVIVFLTTHALYAQVITAKLGAEWERAKAYTKEYLDAMPEDGYAFKPTPEMRSFAGQMSHLADANFAFVAAAAGQKSPFEGSIEKMADQSKAAVTKAVLESYDFAINSMKAMSDAELSKDIKLFGMDMKAGAALEKGFEHQTHHRGQTTVYIRMKGVTPPKEKLF
jgi:uncharacterized damage-inducible protein DinB